MKSKATENEVIHIGDILILKDGDQHIPHMLCRISSSRVILVSMLTGNRWMDSTVEATSDEDIHMKDLEQYICKRMQTSERIKWYIATQDQKHKLHILIKENLVTYKPPHKTGLKSGFTEDI